MLALRSVRAARVVRLARPYSAPAEGAGATPPKPKDRTVEWIVGITLLAGGGYWWYSSQGKDAKNVKADAKALAGKAEDTTKDLANQVSAAVKK
ncbi:uncharacterized protein LOC62_05G007420 [Vanrija pseudolonga]|uniref:Uncharacterized protein n=1 Tax=Vanrija pseudolonga TaxID=143232 RepID=A0AAF0YFG2_9TREE|nr:hypothetical protein LOC62_05G007420 [Vanrija pseudolonga]